MSRNRFESIIWSIHFVNNLTVDEDTKKSDKLWKIRPWLNDLWKNCLSVSPEEHNSVNKILVPFKGRNFLRQYMPNKPHKWGFKLWGRSGISGILFDFDVNQGRSNNNETRCVVSGDVIGKLTSILPENQNYKVFADFFTNLPLTEHLKSKGIWYVGNAKLARLKNCSLMADKDLKKKGPGSFDHRLEENRDIIAVKWFHNKAVHLVSSYAAGFEPIDAVRR